MPKTGASEFDLATAQGYTGAAYDGLGGEVGRPRQGGMPWKK